MLTSHEPAIVIVAIFAEENLGVSVRVIPLTSYRNESGHSMSSKTCIQQNHDGIHPPKDNPPPSAEYTRVDLRYCDFLSGTLRRPAAFNVCKPVFVNHSKLG